uniref:Uncharacterized protein n=1 Tax=Anguilla anguilla TaxID=7936 RepID=A0A0E9T4G9_ANGAN
MAPEIQAAFWSSLYVFLNFPKGIFSFCCYCFSGHGSAQISVLFEFLSFVKKQLML